MALWMWIRDAVDKAREDLVGKSKEIFGVETQVGYVDKNHPEFEWGSELAEKKK